MKRIDKQLFYPLIAALLMTAGCNKENTQEGGTGEIHIGASIETRATVVESTPLTAVQFLRKDVADGSAPGNYNGITPIAGNRASNGNITFTGTPKPTYSLNDQDAFFVAYWPTGTGGTNNVAWQIDGKTDILVSDQYNAGKYSAPLSGAVGNGSPMIFRHQLAQLEVVCKADPDFDLSATTATWGKITKIEIFETYPMAEFNYATCVVSFTGAPATTALLQKDYETTFAPIEIPAKDNKTATAAAMLAPGGATVKLRIVTEKIGVTDLTATFPGSGTLEKGKYHTIPVVFKSNGKIELGTPTIALWGEGYKAGSDETIGKE